MNSLEITGKKFNRLTAIRFIRSDKRRRYWLFQCDCGKKCEKVAARVKFGHIKSCGCKKKEGGHKIHGHALFRKESYFYRVWSRILRRCRNKNSLDFLRYGAKGISVCKEWYDFRNFLRDMYPSFLLHQKKIKKGEKSTIDRIDNSKGYFRKNCRWATMAEQTRNKTTNINLLYKGKKMCLKDFSRIVGLPYLHIYDKYRKDKLTSLFDVTILN